MESLARSGAVLEGVDNAAYLATQQLEFLSWIRRCSIAIANDTNYTWTNPTYKLYEGKLVNLPMKIPPRHTGLIGVNKSAVFASGTSGILSYKSDELTSDQNYLQVGWKVPYMGNNCVHVRIGSEAANEERLYSRFRDDYQFTSASDTSYNEVLLMGNVEADVFMGADGHAVLVVLLKECSSF